LGVGVGVHVADIDVEISGEVNVAGEKDHWAKAMPI